MIAIMKSSVKRHRNLPVGFHRCTNIQAHQECGRQLFPGRHSTLRRLEVPLTQKAAMPLPFSDNASDRQRLSLSEATNSDACGRSHRASEREEHSGCMGLFQESLSRPCPDSRRRFHHPCTRRPDVRQFPLQSLRTDSGLASHLRSRPLGKSRRKPKWRPCRHRGTSEATHSGL